MSRIAENFVDIFSIEKARASPSYETHSEKPEFGAGEGRKHLLMTPCSGGFKKPKREKRSYSTAEGVPGEDQPLIPNQKPP
jgi:hypothetical protein